jgi:glycosyltransferase involved in cell wall biosynthesis
MNSKAPLVSIIIPVYKGENYLAQAIDSALAQTYPHIEVLVINDGSPDNGATKMVAMSYGSRIRYYEKENGGVATALNYGLQQMKGDYFSWLSHDDLYYPEKIQKQIEFLAQSGMPSDLLVYSDFNFIDKDSNYIRDFSIKHVEPTCFKTYFVLGDIVHGCTLLIPKRCFQECGFFNTSLKTTQDYELWFRFSEKFRFAHLREKLVKSRLHAEQGTRQMNTAVIYEGNRLYLHFLKSLKWKEIYDCYDKPVPIYYLDFCIKSSVYRKACKYAFFQALLSFFYLKVRYLKEYIRKARLVIDSVWFNNKRIS